MNVGIQGQLFIVGGATSGFGKAVAEALLAEGANIVAVARTEEKLRDLQQAHPYKVECIVGDITQPETLQQLQTLVGSKRVHGILVNAGGPPAMTAMESRLEDWDAAYQSVLRWKVALVQAFVSGMIEHQYGRFVFVESASVKQPMENLVLSNAMRLAVVGYVKTLSQEIAHEGVTLNVLAPGYHATAAMDRLFKKKSDKEKMSIEDAMLQYVSETPMGFLGAAEDFASLALWLFSPHSRYLTGQTISVDGGILKGTFS